jgi:hypothetical protein
MMQGDWCYTETDRIFVPDTRIAVENIPNGAKTVGLRGYAHSRAVVTSEGKCIGYVVVRNDP